MKVYADLVALKFNESKTGSVWVGSVAKPVGLPDGDIRWAFLMFDQDEARFVIDQKDVGSHIVELHRQLVATKSIFGWVNAYNKYMAFFLRNLGGRPAACFGPDHTSDIIDTLAKIQRELFPLIEGGAVGHLRLIIESRFGIKNLPSGYFYLPIGSGGLELQHPMIEMFAMPQTLPDDRKGFAAQVKEDAVTYKDLKENWENAWNYRDPKITSYEGPMMSFEEYVLLRETRLLPWQSIYSAMLTVEQSANIIIAPSLRAYSGLLSAAPTKVVHQMDWYQQRIFSLYGEEVVKRLEGLEVVDPALIPTGMVQLFRNSRMKLDE